MSLFVRSFVILPPSIYLSIYKKPKCLSVCLCVCEHFLLVWHNLYPDVCPPQYFYNYLSQLTLGCLSPLHPCVSRMSHILKPDVCPHPTLLHCYYLCFPFVCLFVCLSCEIIRPLLGCLSPPSYQMSVIIYALMSAPPPPYLY